jgi:hypothetical protein
MSTGGFMTRARNAVLASLVFLAGGMAATMAVRSANDTRPALLPAEAAILPPDAGFVAGIDVTRLLASPLYQKALKDPSFHPPAEWTELQRAAGITEKDFRQVVVAGEGREKGAAVALVLGTFERKKLEAGLAGMRDMKSRDYNGRKLWIAPPPAQTPAPRATLAAPTVKPTESAFTVLADGVLVVGPPDSVTAALDRQAAKAPGLLGNAAMLALVQQVRPGSAFWLCGNETVLAAAANVAPTGGFNVPTLRSLVASGDVLPDLSLQVVAEAADAAAAKTLAGMLQAVTGLIAMQGDKPELKELVSGLEVVNEGNQVRISARARYETLEKLAARPTPAPVTPRPAASGPVVTAPPHAQPAKK